MINQKSAFKKIVLTIFSIFILSSCGQNENVEVDSNFLLTNITDNHVVEPKNESVEVLPKPLEIPINSKIENIQYYCEDGIVLMRALHRSKADGENIYLVHGEPDLYVMPIGTDKHNPANIGIPNEMDVCNIALDVDGKIHLLISANNNEEWYIWQLNESFQVDKKINVSAYFETNHLPLWFLIDKDGTYYLKWVMKRNGIIIDNDGELMHRFTPESLGVRWIFEAAIGKDGQIYLVHGHPDEQLEIALFDVKNCFLKNDYPTQYFPGSETFSLMSSGTDTNLLLFSPYTGVWAYDNENEIIENRVPLSDIDFGSDAEFWPLTFLPDGRLLLVGQTINESSADDNINLFLKYIPVGN